MSQLMSAVKQFIDDEAGITAIEYGLIAAVMVSVIGVIFASLTTPLKTLFTAIAGKLVLTTT